MQDTASWYENLIKPSWAPPDWLFGPAWMVLYIIIFITFGTVFYRFFSGKLSWLVALPFALNLIFNFSFTSFQFGLKNNFLASIDIILILVTLVWAMAVIYPHLRWITYALVPYFLWVSFATALQLSITYLNR